MFFFRADTIPCLLTSWSDWSDCSVTCGKGLRTRQRTLKSPVELGDCTEELEQVEKCMLPECRKYASCSRDLPRAADGRSEVRGKRQNEATICSKPNLFRAFFKDGIYCNLCSLIPHVQHVRVGFGIRERFASNVLAPQTLKWPFKHPFRLQWGVLPCKALLINSRKFRVPCRTQ